MSRLNKGNGNGRSGGSSGTGGSSPAGNGLEPDSGLKRALQSLSKKLPEGYSVIIEKTGRVPVVCTDRQLAELDKSSKARVFVLRKDGELKATKVTPMNLKPNGNGPNQPAIARPRKPQPKNDDQPEMTPISKKKKRFQGLHSKRSRAST
jgi:hypothetical protein